MLGNKTLVGVVSPVASECCEFRFIPFRISLAWGNKSQNPQYEEISLEGLT